MTWTRKESKGTNLLVKERSTAAAQFIVDDHEYDRISSFLLCKLLSLSLSLSLSVRRVGGSIKSRAHFQMHALNIRGTKRIWTELAVTTFFEPGALYSMHCSVKPSSFFDPILRIFVQGKTQTHGGPICRYRTSRPPH